MFSFRPVFNVSLIFELLTGLSTGEAHKNSKVKRDASPSASDHKALSLPSFSVTQTLVNLLAEKGGMLLFCDIISFKLQCTYQLIAKVLTSNERLGTVIALKHL